jgi:hypothetical protein
MLQAQSSREINLRKACHEIGEKSWEIIPLGARSEDAECFMPPILRGRAMFPRQ